MSRLALIAIGGNSLLQDPRRSSYEDQYQAVLATCEPIVSLLDSGWKVVITHGNGPQVGSSLLRSEMARSSVSPMPMEGAVAETQGSIGYQIQQALGNRLRQKGIERSVVTVVTQVEVAEDDPAFQNPTKPIGSFMDEATARQRAERDGWSVMEDAGRGWRRVVPSPRPQSIVETEVIRSLVEAGCCVICAGGGGIPVLCRDQQRVGVAAVIDKDLASGLLAGQLQAQLFVISTSVERVSLHFGTPAQQEIQELTTEQARQYLQEGHFRAGSMRPKIEAALAFVQLTGGRAVITCPELIEAAVAGQAGTQLLSVR